MIFLQENKNYKIILTRQGLKNTKHRNSILEILSKCDVPVTAEDIYLNLKNHNVSISLSTVYRTLETLCSKGLVLKINISEDNKALFELNGMEHRHHLVCVVCKKMFSVEGCPLEEFEKAVQEKTGFNVMGHKLEIFGHCPNCFQKKICSKY